MQCCCGQQFLRRSPPGGLYVGRMMWAHLSSINGSMLQIHTHSPLSAGVKSISKQTDFGLKIHNMHVIANSLTYRSISIYNFSPKGQENCR